MNTQFVSSFLNESSRKLFTIFLTYYAPLSLGVLDHAIDGMNHSLLNPNVQCGSIYREGLWEA